MGNIIQPDWDMFQSTHPSADFHAASRAISGGPVYVSDSVGKHNFELLKRLVLPNGSNMRCQYHALPTRDSLFADPLHDSKSMLKIWNVNKHSGVLGIFNCQGGGWCRQSRANKSAPECAKVVTGKASPRDIEWHNAESPFSLKGMDTFAVYMFQGKKLKLLKPPESIEISILAIDYELLIVSPVKILPRKRIRFAPIGLVNTLNSEGAVQSIHMDENDNKVEIGIKGHGEMRIFASEKPLACKIDGMEVKFRYDDMMVVVQVPWPGSSPKLAMIECYF